MDKIELPPLPEKEKTYAGIPEAVFVVSENSVLRIGEACERDIVYSCTE